MLLRFFIYGLLGWAGEILWTGLPKQRPVDWTLSGHTQWWTFPLYGSIAFLYEPLHEFLRAYPIWLHGFVYMVGFFAVEFIAALLIKLIVGKIPWDYSHKTRWQFLGAIRFDYAPLWFGLGLLLEPIHDYLVRITPALLAALH